MSDTVLTIEHMPFWLGAFDVPSNPQGIPNTFPFKLELNRRMGLFSQQDSAALQSALQKSYDFGSTVGNAMDDSDLGKRYCDDFLSFVNQSIGPNSRVLEIGAGRGFLAAQLNRAGHRVVGLEPGSANAAYWPRYGVSIIQDYFPSSRAPGKFDAILFYGVLEHIADSQTFLQAVLEQLEPDGVILLSVPDCGLELAHGDPSMLLHEHYHYFTSASLRRVLTSVGLRAKVKRSGYARSLYASAKRSVVTHEAVGDEELTSLETYPSRVNVLKKTILSQLDAALSRGSLGVFCPARALNVLPSNCPVRFFDDSSDLHGKYYPPFHARIESREELLANPPLALWIMSRTFGPRLASELRHGLPSTKVLTADELTE